MTSTTTRGRLQEDTPMDRRPKTWKEEEGSTGRGGGARTEMKTGGGIVRGGEMRTEEETEVERWTETVSEDEREMRTEDERQTEDDVTD